ncbi:hypothetical protein UFOVP116_157 [uncultured Caudovirales phage]|uniref:Uncharacterized protein n=1 Tax=uncultured Caudovirales phage TaxID=2100421 RepID=A0A6J5L6Z4_9CAUD|nr:hypothetical protein UFOVP116_157 [uncultured Caudovirales phage]
MINLNFSISNPWSTTFDIKWARVFALTTYKSLEMALYRCGTIVGFGFNITGFKRDHAGFTIDLYLCGYNVSIVFYDIRHHDQRENNE